MKLIVKIGSVFLDFGGNPHFINDDIFEEEIKNEEQAKEILKSWNIYIMAKKPNGDIVACVY